MLNSTPDACRRFLRSRLLLDEPLRTVDAAVLHHGYIQIDPIDVCGRMHDLILRNRVRNYQRGDLLDALYGRPLRTHFEHYVGVLVALPVEDYRHLLPSLKLRRKSDAPREALDAGQKRMARGILERIRTEGPLGAADFARSGRSRTDWGTTGTLAKTTLDKLFFQGRLLISRRDRFRRVFDLPERILPEAILESKPASRDEVRRWHIGIRLRQRRLVTLSHADLALVRDLVSKVAVAGHPPFYCLNQDTPQLEAAADGPASSGDPRLLAPLDPIIYDRKITRRLWDFDYTWEVYTPPAKRVRGYYALPVLSGNRIVGHVDPKADRGSDTLHVKVVVERGTEYEKSINDLARFLSINTVNISKGPGP